MKGQPELVSILSKHRLDRSENSSYMSRVQEQASRISLPVAEQPSSGAAREWDTFEVWRRHIKNSR